MYSPNPEPEELPVPAIGAGVVVGGVREEVWSWVVLPVSTALTLDRKGI